MSYPDNGIAERWVLAGYQSDDPIVIDCTPYVVILGDKQDDCLPPCPEQERRNIGQQNEEFLTTVYTQENKTAFTVNVQADTPITYNQHLYILNAVAGNVLLTNVDTGNLPLWGKVFDFGKSNNFVTPNTNVWLQENDTGITGCVEAVMVDCCCPDVVTLPDGCDIAVVPSNVLIVLPGSTCPDVYNTLGEAMVAASPNDEIWVYGQTTENSDIIHDKLVDVVLKANSQVRLGTAQSWIITAGFVNVICESDSIISSALATNTQLILVSDNGEVKFTRANIASIIATSQIAVNVIDNGVVRFDNCFVQSDSNSAVVINSTGGIEAEYSEIKSTHNASPALYLISDVASNIEIVYCIIDGEFTGIQLDVLFPNYKILHNVIRGDNQYSLSSVPVWNNANLSMNTLINSGLGHLNNITITVGLTNDTI